VSSIGNTLDYYDLLIAGTVAVTVWPIIYFEPATKNPAIATALGISTFALGYLVRPIGAFIFGHLGDKIGRKYTLVFTLLISFIGMLGMGLTPSYADIGILSVILIILFRLILGLGFGGEWGGGAAWLTEFAYKTKKLGLYTAMFTGFGPGTGFTLSSILYVIFATSLSKDYFINFGWRILFFIGSALLIIRVIIRYFFLESPVFSQIKLQGKISRYPAAEVLRKYSVKILQISVNSLVPSVITSVFLLTIMPAYISALTKGSAIMGISPAAFAQLSMGIGAGISIIAAYYIAGFLLDKYLYYNGKMSPKRIFQISCILCAIFVYPFVLLVNTLNPLLIIISYILLNWMALFGHAIQALVFTKEFETKYRYSGAGLALQIGGLFAGIYGGAIVPLILSLTGSLLTGIVWISIGLSIICIISLVAFSLLKERPENPDQWYET